MLVKKMLVSVLLLIGVAVLGAACAGSGSESLTTTRQVDVEVAENDEAVRAAVEPFIGQSLVDFTANVSELGYTVLLVTEGQGGIGSYQSNRVRVAVADDVVVQVIAVG